MSLLDFFKSGASKCAHCKKETHDLPFTKKLDGELKRFCSKECSRKFRVARKRKGRKPPDTGSSMPW